MITRKVRLSAYFLLLSACVAGKSRLNAQSTVSEPAADPQLINTSIPYCLDTYQGKTELVPIHHATVTLNKHTGRNITGALTESVFYHPQMTTDLPGEHAKTQIHTQTLVIYLHVDEDSDPEGEDKGDKIIFTVVPAKLEKDHRVVTQMSFNQFTSHGKRKDNGVIIKQEKMAGGWMRLTVQSALTPGEYVFLAEPAQGSTYATTVYPFGIDANAPEMAGTIKPEESTIPGLK